ncbi:DNA primase/helicase [Ralstonia phage RPSC1]|uniref:DNA helicase/primase n=1 Tax=Ralstonia phage RPSC1 TaxID=2041351 RepID=A0A2Z2U7X9_9CAUD|nr:DNA primase/helicase [Ralstonia phage RPSC1]ATN92963.1 DNA primase/helicase-like protein [Ralstonia phage RPSC1]
MSDHEESFLTHKGPCEKCGSSDGNAHYTDGHTHCFVCDAHTPGDGEGGTRAPTRRAEGTLSMGQCDGAYVALPARKIDIETCRKYGYWVGRVNGERVQVADYRDESGAIIGHKLRDKNKDFRAVGKVSRDTLWGAHLWSGKGKKIVITEGEIDCLTVAQMQGLKWPVVSLPCGAAAAKKTLAANIDYLDGYEEIILMFDMDEPGQQAVRDAAEVLPPGKVRVANLPLKDPNACLVDGKGQAILDAIWNASPYRPDGIVMARDLLEEMDAAADVQSIAFPLGAILNARTLGARGGEVVMLTSGTGMGKSTFAREVAYGWGHLSGMRGGLAFIEESPTETLLDITGLHLNKRIRQHPHLVTKEERRAASAQLFDNDTYAMYDHFGSAQEDSLINKLIYMAVVLECKWIVLDHLSIIVSGQEGDDERKMIDRIMTKLKTFAKANNVILIVVTHLKRKDGKGGKSHEEGGKVTLAELRGSGSIAQLSDTCLAFERDQQGDKPNMILIRVLKCRFTGDTGPAGYLMYDKETGRMTDHHAVFPEDEPEGEPTDSAFPPDF